MNRAVILALVLLAACTGGSPSVAPATDEPARASALGPGKAPPPVRMISGTDAVAGTITTWCVGEKCTVRDAKPSRSLRAVPSGLLMFATSQAPAAARAQVRKGAKVIEQADLLPGTTMAFLAEVPRGRYTVILIATYPGREARWVFGLLR